MMNLVKWSAAVPALLIAAGNLAVKADPPTIVATTFEKDAGDWRLINLAGQPTDAASIIVSHDAADIKEGKGTLKFKYSIAKTDVKGDTNMLALMLQPPSLVKMKSMHFWVKLDHAGSLLLVVGEKEGGRYQEIIACPANTWQEVSVGVGDLSLNVDDGSPPDPDGKLDPDQIDSVSIIDADCFLRQVLGDATFINIASGTHTMLINSFTIDETALPAQPAAPAGERFVAPLVRPQLDWLVLGDMSVQKVEEKPLTGPSLRASYTQTQGKVFGLIKTVPVGSFAGITQVCLNVASTKPTKLMVQVEEVNGNKYNTNIETGGGSEAKNLVLNLSDFAVAGDSKDPNGKLDLAQVKQIVIIDGSGMGAIQDTPNVLWINGLKTVKK